MTPSHAYQHRVVIGFGHIPYDRGLKLGGIFSRPMGLFAPDLYEIRRSLQIRPVVGDLETHVELIGTIPLPCGAEGIGHERRCRRHKLTSPAPEVIPVEIADRMDGQGGHPTLGGMFRRKYHHIGPESEPLGLLIDIFVVNMKVGNGQDHIILAPFEMQTTVGPEIVPTAFGFQGRNNVDRGNISLTRDYQPSHFTQNLPHATFNADRCMLACMTCICSELEFKLTIDF